MEPKQFWSKFLKVFMIIGIIIGVIASIAFAVKVAWWIAPVGCIATFLMFSVLGLAIETSENISAQVKLLDTIVNYLISEELEHSTDYIPDAGSANPMNDPYSLNKDSSDSVQETSNAAPTTRNVYEKKDRWTCPACGELNDLDTIVCKRCDQQVWVCPKCGEGNGFDNTACSKCGWEA